MSKKSIWVVAVFAAASIAGGCDDDDEDGNGGSGGTGGTATTTTTSSSAGAGPCAGTACNDSSPDTACEACIDDHCGTEGGACEADSQSGACIGCAEFLSGGSWEDVCPDSKQIFATFLECICGDGQGAGACG